MPDRMRHLVNCYACGPDNERGLRLVIEADDTGVKAKLRFDERFMGAPGLVHGGVLAAVLDDLLGALPLDGRGVRVTKELQIRYRSPAPVGQLLLASARMAGDGSAVGEIRLAEDGVVCCDAIGEFVLLTP